jgi:hypothetical protein
VTAPASILWRPADLRRTALRLLVAGLFEATLVTPLLLVIRAGGVPSQIFTDDLAVRVPVLRVTVTPDGEIVDDWLVPPPPGSPAQSLAATLAERGLLLEPFERAGEGLKEANAHPQPPPPARGERV